jgi:hypothetical protein
VVGRTLYRHGYGVLGVLRKVGGEHTNDSEMLDRDLQTRFKASSTGVSHDTRSSGVPMLVFLLASWHLGVSLHQRLHVHLILSTAFNTMQHTFSLSRALSLATPNTPPIVSPRRLQILLLPSRPRVLVQMPLDITFLILQRSSPDFKKPHAHPRSHLRQLNSLVSSFDKHMVSHFNRVFNVLEPIHTLATGYGNHPRTGTYVTTLLPILLVPSRGGNKCFKTVTMRSPSLVVKPSKMRCG